MSKLGVVVLCCGLLLISALVAAKDPLDEALDAFALLPRDWHCQMVNQSSLVGGASASSAMLYTLSCNGTLPPMPEALQQLIKAQDIQPWLPRSSKSTATKITEAQQQQLPSTFNITIVVADLTANPKLYLAPVLAQQNSMPVEPSPYRQTVLGMAQDQQQAGLRPLAGINGGYFFFLKSSPTDVFFDSNCFQKFDLNFANRSTLTSFDIGDGVHIAKGRPYSWNCPTLGKYGAADKPARAAFFQDAAGQLHIANLPAGPLDVASLGLQNAIGSGPMLMQNGTVDLEWQEISSTFELSANTAFGLGKSLTSGHQIGLMFTVSGRDGELGMRSADMTNFLLLQVPALLKVRLSSAMSMDQGGSTTMVVWDPVANQLRLVTSSGEDRSVYDSLFLFTQE